MAACRAAITALLAGLVAAGLTAAVPAFGGTGVAVSIIVGTGPEPTGEERRVKGRVVAQGPFTPGEQTSLLVSRMPKRAILIVLLGPVPDTPRCAGSGRLCIPEFLEPEDDRFFWETSGRGRAKITFTMPRRYQAVPLGTLTKSRPKAVPYRDRQAVGITVAAAKVSKHGTTVIGTDSAKTFAELPAPAVEETTP